MLINTAARFFIDVWSVGGRALRESVQNTQMLVDVPPPRLFLDIKKNHKYHTSLSKGAFNMLIFKVKNQAWFDKLTTNGFNQRLPRGGMSF